MSDEISLFWGSQGSSSASAGDSVRGLLSVQAPRPHSVRVPDLETDHYYILGEQGREHPTLSLVAREVPTKAPQSRWCLH